MSVNRSFFLVRHIIFVSIPSSFINFLAMSVNLSMYGPAMYSKLPGMQGVSRLSSVSLSICRVVWNPGPLIGLVCVPMSRFVTVFISGSGVWVSLFVLGEFVCLCSSLSMGAVSLLPNVMFSLFVGVLSMLFFVVSSLFLVVVMAAPHLWQVSELVLLFVMLVLNLKLLVLQVNLVLLVPSYSCALLFSSCFRIVVDRLMSSVFLVIIW